VIAIVGEEEAVEHEKASDGAAECETPRGTMIRGQRNEEDDGKEQEKGNDRETGYLAR
jgi:hypothetical protein